MFFSFSYFVNQNHFGGDVQCMANIVIHLHVSKSTEIQRWIRITASLVSPGTLDRR